MAVDAEVEEIELSLIRSDLQDAFRLFPASGEEDEGTIPMLVLPAAAFVAEESFAYFSRAKRTTRWDSLDGPLRANYSGSLTKVRSRLKLFDDTDAGPTNLASFTALARKKSRVLFSHPSNKLLQFISAPFRPDLGVYFLNEDLVATTHALLPSLGFTMETLTQARPGEFGPFRTHAHDFAMAMGSHLAHLANVLEKLGHPPAARFRNGMVVPISSNDFVARSFYRHAERELKGIRPELVPSLTLCLGQTNVAGEVLPLLLDRESNLLARMQFLTAYHASSALRSSTLEPPKWLSAPNDVLASPKLRNMFAHYELRGAASAAIGATRPFDAAVSSCAGVPFPAIMTGVRERLKAIAEYLGPPFRKSRLWPIRAICGEHS